MIEVEVLGIRLEEGMNSPILMLQEQSGQMRVLELWIGAVEAGAIAFSLQDLKSPRPLTHELILDTLAAAGVEISSVEVTELRSGTYYAEISLSNGARVSARPSDAVAIAVHAGVNVYVAEAVMDEAGKVVESEIAEEDQIEEFREFLENLNPEDFSA